MGDPSGPPSSRCDQASPHIVEASPPSLALCDQCHETSHPYVGSKWGRDHPAVEEAGDAREDLRGRTCLSEDRDSGNGPH